MNNINGNSIWLINNRTNEFSKINLATILFLKNQVSSTHVREASRAFRKLRLAILYNLREKSGAKIKN
jgi:hypothetical protein